MSDTVELYGHSGRRVVGVGDEVVISDGYGRFSIDKITAITKATIKTTQKTFTRKSQKEYGSGESWRCAQLDGTHPDKAREQIAQQQAKDALRRAYNDARKRMNDESDDLTMEDIAAIVAVLDNAKQRVDAGVKALQEDGR
jgi:hypothetical protein